MAEEASGLRTLRSNVPNENWGACFGRLAWLVRVTVVIGLPALKTLSLLLWTEHAIALWLTMGGRLR